MAEVKFCGLTRAADADVAVRLGARYVGVILASGPRRLEPEQARAVLAGVPKEVSRVGVFGAREAAAIAGDAERAGVDVAQLHGDPDVTAVTAVRGRFNGMVWAVIRVAGSTIPPGAEGLFDVADAVVLDARSERGLGGTGVPLPWGDLVREIERFRARRAALVLAGGLAPSNVREAIAALSPDIVDVSSGVESAPGIKDHTLMGAFIEGARARRGTA